MRKPLQESEAKLFRESVQGAEPIRINRIEPFRHRVNAAQSLFPGGKRHSARTEPCPQPVYRQLQRFATQVVHAKQIRQYEVSIDHHPVSVQLLL